MRFIYSALVAAVLATSFTACSTTNTDPHREVELTGVVRLPLEATAESGNVYRLRSAHFFISGPQSLVASPADDASPTFATALGAGVYSIELIGGWQLWRMGP